MSWFSFQPFLVISNERLLKQKNILSRNGTAKSMCILSHGEDGHSQGCNGAMAAYSGSSDIQNTVLLTSRCRYHFPATKHSFELTPSSLLRLGDFHVTDLRSVCEV